jgi:hypothetical protein
MADAPNDESNEADGTSTAQNKSTGDDAVLVRLGRHYVEQQLAISDAEVVVHPKKAELLEWLADDHVKGKFDWGWHRKIADAREGWRIEVDPIWNALASLFDLLFPDTRNHFNEFEKRPPVTEELLYPHLEQSHGLTRDQSDRLRLPELLWLLQQDSPPVASGGGFKGGEELREALGIHPTQKGAFEHQLSRKRKHLGDDNWREVKNPTPNDAKFLYRVDSQAVRDLAEPYKAPISS